MKKTLWILAIAAASTAQAVQVENVAGSLASNVNDKNVTSLTVTGTVDARDFKFMGQELTALEQLDLSGATIVAFEAEEAILGSTLTYAANEVPTMAFFGHNTLQQVTLPSSAVTIADAAFAGCSKLTAIEPLAQVTTYGDYALSATALTTLDLPATVTTMGTGVASRCASLTTVNVATPTLGEAAFKDCAALAQANLASTVSVIGDEAFAGDIALTTLDLTADNTLSAIGQKAFMGSGLAEINLQDCASLTTVGMWAMANTPLRTIILPESVTEVDTGAFFYDTQLQSVVLPQGTTSISDYIFSGDNAMNVDENAFLPEGVTEVGDYALYNWDQLASILIPSSVNHIGTKAMAGMTGLTTVVAKPTTVPELGDEVWAGVDQPNIPLKVAKAVANDYRNAEQWKEFKIEGVKTEVDEATVTRAQVQAHFEGTLLVVSANENIARLSVHALNGVLLNEVNAAGTVAHVDTVNYNGNVYLVTVTLESGLKRVFKLAR